VIDQSGRETDEGPRRNPSARAFVVEADSFRGRWRRPLLRRGADPD